MDHVGDSGGGPGDGRDRNPRQGAGKLQPPPQLRPPLAAKRPERERRVRVAGTQQPHGNLGHLLVMALDTLWDNISEVT